MKRAIALLLLPFVLAACGGNGSSSSSLPTGVQLLDIPATLPSPQVTDLSSDGATVAGISNNHAFVWSYTGGFTDLGATPVGTLTNLRVSSDGSVVAGTAVSSSSLQQVVYSSAGSALAVFNSKDGSVTKVSNDGTVVGGYRNPSNSASQVGAMYHTDGVVVTDFPQADMDAGGTMWYFDGTSGILYKWVSNARSTSTTVTAPGSTVPFQISGDGSILLYQTSGAMHFIKISGPSVTDVTIPSGYTADSLSLSYDGTNVVFPEGLYVKGTGFETVAEWLTAANLSSSFAGWTNLSAIKLSKDNKSLLGKGTNSSNQTQYWIARSAS